MMTGSPINDLSSPKYSRIIAWMHFNHAFSHKQVAEYLESEKIISRVYYEKTLRDRLVDYGLLHKLGSDKELETLFRQHPYVVERVKSSYAGSRERRRAYEVFDRSAFIRQMLFDLAPFISLRPAKRAFKERETFPAISQKDKLEIRQVAGGICYELGKKRDMQDLALYPELISYAFWKDEPAADLNSSGSEQGIDGMASLILDDNLTRLLDFCFRKFSLIILEDPRELGLPVLLKMFLVGCAGQTAIKPGPGEHSRYHAIARFCRAYNIIHPFFCSAEEQGMLKANKDLTLSAKYIIENTIENMLRFSRQKNSKI